MSFGVGDGVGNGVGNGVGVGVGFGVGPPSDPELGGNGVGSQVNGISFIDEHKTISVT